MTPTYILPLADSKASIETVGGKGASLARLVNSGFPVPDGFHITTEAYQQLINFNELSTPIQTALDTVDIARPATLDAASQVIIEAILEAVIPPEIASAIVQAYAAIPGKDPAVAVRSSATAEDLPEASFAGQQDSYLNISGADRLLEAIKRCWASLWTARAISYRIQQGIKTEGVALAVVVQLLVPADVAGILFTANSMTGVREQALINASWGLGEAIVGGKVTPDTIVVDKESGQIVDYEVADKQVMTVRVNGATEEQAVPESLRKVPALSEEDTQKLTDLGTKIESLFEMPMDIEWTLTDGNLAIVQARPITALPAAQAAPPTEWPLPDPKARYMRTSIVDLMPDPLSPLFATAGLSAINRGIASMSQELLNMPEGVELNVMLTINGYAYQSTGFPPRVWWLLLTRMVPSFPRMLREGVPYWQDVAHPRYAEIVRQWTGKSLTDLPPAELLAGVNQVLDAFAHHLGALMSSTMGPSSGSEVLFTNVYSRLIQKDGDPDAPTFLMGFNSIPIQAEKALYDLSEWCREEQEFVVYLSGTQSKTLIEDTGNSTPPSGVDPGTWGEWKKRFNEHLERYGYSIYDMDFAKPLPMDDPLPIIEMLKLFITDQTKNPYQRQQIFIDRREAAVQSVLARIKGLRRWGFNKSLHWAQSQAPLREDGIAEIGLGYPVLRKLFLELGQLFMNAEAIQEARDIYWLEEHEVEELVNGLENRSTPREMNNLVEERKALWRAQKSVNPPPQLPPGKKYMGFDMDGVLAGGEGALEGNVLKGVPSSPGQITAPARVLAGPEDFDQMQPGEILVAGITTPAWTPLFAMASGVVTDIGGPLSHGSIVAREYGIPAVLGTGLATRCISNGQLISIDGNAGTVTLHINE
ncbi:MAG TPA: PEP/pyruvate-binding domain-containing protein [Anaerolineales bacterium]|nr:PEP/pyruvate-binding domain-containing protein [Anaerolineales bacterium]